MEGFKRIAEVKGLERRDALMLAEKILQRRFQTFLGRLKTSTSSLATVRIQREATELVRGCTERGRSKLADTLIEVTIRYSTIVASINESKVLTQEREGSRAVIDSILEDHLRFAEADMNVLLKDQIAALERLT